MTPVRFFQFLPDPLAQGVPLFRRASPIVEQFVDGSQLRESQPMDKKKKASDFGRRLFNLFFTTSVQFNTRNGKLGLELSNATSSIYEIFAVLFCEAHNPKVVSSNLTPATI